MQTPTQVKQSEQAGLSDPSGYLSALGASGALGASVSRLRMPIALELKQINLWRVPVICGGSSILGRLLLAMGQTLLHIDYSRPRGQLQRSQSGDGIFRYTRA